MTIRTPAYPKTLEVPVFAKPLNDSDSTVSHIIERDRFDQVKCIGDRPLIRQQKRRNW